MMRTILGIALLAAACGPGGRHGNGDDGTGVSTCPSCSADNTAVVDCDGNSTECPADMGCSMGACMNACDAAEQNHSSVGCEYYAVDMDAASGPPQDACYTVFVANVSRDPVHITAEWNGQSIDLSRYAKLPQGLGTSLTYGNYDPNAGLAPGEVAILFLAYSFQLGNVACPVPAAIGHGPQLSGTGIGHAFHITTDMPVVAYQMLPYGGGNAAATGASLLLPTSAWGQSYIAASAYDQPAPPIPLPIQQGNSHDYVAMVDNTHVTIRPISDLAAGGGMPAGLANQPYTVTLMRGDYFQITQNNPLSGSQVTSDQPVGGFGGHQIMTIDRCCGDHGEQMLAPVRALGSEYVAAPHGDRKPAGSTDPRVFRIYGAVDGTMLEYEPAGAGPATISTGQMVEIRGDGPFVVRSQDSNHPFEMFTYMTGSGEVGEGGWGDPDFVRLPPPDQYMSHTVFFTDVTYPFTGLTVVRKLNTNKKFDDVILDCLGPITDWQPVGTAGTYEIAWVKLVDHWQGQNGCNNGVHVMSSTTPFGSWVWGWGSEDTSTGWVSYGYPAGENVLPINDVVLE
jgi:hypothetical protein